MDRTQFLASISEQLAGLPQEDIQKSLDYYDEMLCDRIEDGMSEEDAVAELGAPEEIAEQILLDTPLPKLIKARTKTMKKPSSTAMHAWEIVLIVLGSPIWLALIIAAAAVVIALASTVLAIYISLWAVLFSIFVSALALAISFIAGITLGIIFLCTGKAPSAVLLLGGALICGGLAILFYLLSKLLAVGFAKGTKAIFAAIKKAMIRKGER